MIIPSPHTGIKPKIGNNVFIAPTATIIGDVTINDGSNIWYGAVIRGDVCTIKIGKNVSVQDNCVIHSEAGTTCTIGDNIIMGHKAIVHGPCTIGNNVMVGLGSTVLAGSQVGDGAMIAAGAVARKEVRAKTLVMGIPAVEKKTLTDEEVEGTIQNSEFYMKNGKKFIEQGYNHPGIEEFQLNIKN
jgi:carbonic anhydrase/acetyltransferase-like protein (isoleucine patch superfamily)